MFIAEQLTAAYQTQFLAKRIIFSFIFVVVVLLLILELNSLQDILLVVFQICISYLIFEIVSYILLSSRLCGRINPFRKAVLITGCDSGFGFSIAKRLNKAGFQVFAACLSPLQGGGKELNDLPNLHCLKMDVTELDDINLAYEFVLEHLDQNELWAVINNAGIGNASPIEIVTMSSIEEVVNVNLLGMIRVTKTFLPLLRKSNGRVINIASIAGRLVMPGFVPYSVSKHALIAFSDGLRLEVQKFGVSVVTIEPWAYRCFFIFLLYIF
ncbi:D-beta-hydroxybutyrate dehydrogenase, mitochondrial-like [Stegodyphus dumicola]|uniref:D-beta-hydroxybutyrate dehydrogenase, mitochondrial-like n=1 Tax=Stegodyphus dumicola TaxID=202533 RepID=UPI0015A8F6B3|nr:D-beta-hydroxybutyrate dehydrogenase, mitochondrial-like [Stegodyphus dumicola]